MHPFHILKTPTKGISHFPYSNPPNPNWRFSGVSRTWFWKQMPLYMEVGATGGWMTWAGGFFWLGHFFVQKSAPFAIEIAAEFCFALFCWNAWFQFWRMYIICKNVRVLRNLTCIWEDLLHISPVVPKKYVWFCCFNLHGSWCFTMWTFIVGDWLVKVGWISPIQGISDHIRELATTVDGSEIRRAPVEVGGISHYLQGFSTIPGGCPGFLPSTVSLLSSYMRTWIGHDFTRQR